MLLRKSLKIKGKEEGHKSRRHGDLRGPDLWSSLCHPKVSLGLGSLTDHLAHHLSNLQLVTHHSSKCLGAISLGKEVKAMAHK